MVSAESGNLRYQTHLTNGLAFALADTTADKGGGGTGFRPHDLLEAALAACLNIQLRMYADNHGIKLDAVRTGVSLDRSHPPNATFNCSIEVTGAIDEKERAKLLNVARSCSVHKTLMRAIDFRYSEGPPEAVSQ